MKIKHVQGIVVGALLMLTTDVFATNGMRMIGFGPIQRSMGGVSVGTALDAASLLTNPAGMTDLKARIDFGASYFSPAVEYKATGAAPGVMVSDGVTVESDKGASPVPAFGLIAPISEKITFGIGAYGISGMGVDYEQNLYQSILSTSYSQMRFAPGIAYKISNMISVGAVVNIMYATMEFSAATNGTAAGFPADQQEHMGAASFGYGGTVGITVKPIEMVKVGLAYETKSVFQDFKFNTDTGRDKLEFNQPQNITFGIAVMPVDGLILAADVQWIQWSDTNGENLPEYTENTGAMAWNLNWDDQIVYKLGLQYSINPIIDVRAGFNYGKMPLDENRAFENIAFPAIAEYHYTAGFGVHFNNNLALNVGGMFSPEAKISGSNAAGQFIAEYETSMSQYSFDVGIAYTF